MNVNKLMELKDELSAGLLYNDREMPSRVDNFVDNSRGFNHKRLKYN